MTQEGATRLLPFRSFLFCLQTTWVANYFFLFSSILLFSSSSTSLHPFDSFTSPSCSSLMTSTIFPLRWSLRITPTRSPRSPQSSREVAWSSRSWAPLVNELSGIKTYLHNDQISSLELLLNSQSSRVVTALMGISSLVFYSLAARAPLVGSPHLHRTAPALTPHHVYSPSGSSTFCLRSSQLFPSSPTWHLRVVKVSMLPGLQFTTTTSMFPTPTTNSSATFSGCVTWTGPYLLLSFWLISPLSVVFLVLIWPRLFCLTGSCWPRVSWVLTMATLGPVGCGWPSAACLISQLYTMPDSMLIGPAQARKLRSSGSLEPFPA